ncbi:PREDICTED: uncharacterized protein LOC106932261 isoform X1 [Poecilia mexicana]|uniref:uncharacterized protein LOC106932261 isoform X1 n=1 Tax=Poecilia mexicana TaxID=48701 RepID=UPI00072ED742|nr:PREDICTED: uncharacterized protein LOC106932261 isoform X1 [Poecilia mexicana]
MGEKRSLCTTVTKDRSGATFVQAEILTEKSGEEIIESRSVQTPEDPTRTNSGVWDEEILEDQCIGHAETFAEGTVVATVTQGDEDYLPETRLSTGEDTSPLSASSHPSTTQNAPSEPCWYCLRSLDSESHPNVTKQEEDSDPESHLPSSGQKVNYQTDPRPHFGVACSSHSTCRPLWGSEGPCWEPRNQELTEQTDTCPHCHLGLPPDTLRWHEAKCLLFDGLRSSKKEN